MTTQTNANIVKAFLSNARGAEYGAIKALIAAAECMQDGNTDPMSKMLAVCNGKLAKRLKIIEKAKMTYANPIRNVLYAAGLVQGKKGQYVWDKSKDFGVTWNLDDYTFDQEIINTLKVLATSMMSSKEFKEAFPNPPTETKNKSVEELQEMVAKYLQKMQDDHGVKITGDVVITK